MVELSFNRKCKCIPALFKKAGDTVLSIVLMLQLCRMLSLIKIGLLVNI